MRRLQLTKEKEAEQTERGEVLPYCVDGLGGKGEAANGQEES